MFNSDKSQIFRNLKKLVPGMVLGLCCTAYAADNSLIPALMDEGMKHYSEKKYAAAADYLGQVVDIDAEHSQARYYLVYSLALSGNQEQALKHAEILAKKFPSDPQYTTLVNQIKTEIAKKAKIKKQTASNKKIQKEVMLGGYQSLDKNAEIRKPKEDYTPRDIKPPKPLTELEKAIKKIDEEEFDEAERMLNEIVKKEPKNSEALHNLGVIEMNRYKYKEAIDYFKKASEMNPKSFQSWFLLADCYRNIGDDVNCEKSLKTATDLKYDEFALMNFADVKIELGKLNEAEAIYNKILEKTPSFSEASVGLAQIRISQGKLDEAMNMVNAALASGNTGEANYVKALILYTSRMYNEALEQIQVALGVVANNPKYILTRAQIFIELLDFTRAIDDANSVLSKNPESIAARLAVAKAFILTSAEDDAEAQLAEIAKRGDNAEYYKLSGLLEKRRGNDEQAKKHYEKFFQMAGGIPANAFEYAEFLEGIDSEKGEAEAVYNAIIKRYPDSFFAERAKENLSGLKGSDESGTSEDAAFDSKPNNNLRPGNMKY